MSFSFEVKESDLLGRIGTLTVGGKRVETPCLLPVIHPVRQLVTTDELRTMGFTALMTNSLILYTRRREEALEKKIHALLGFDGVFMTDSGGYQVLEYGDVKVSYKQIADFQSKIGSNLAVTLDRPTGFSLSREFARDTVDYSLRNAKLTLKQWKKSSTVWVGPIQGGLFTDLLRKSAKELTESGFRFLALGSPTQVMENYRFAELVKMIVATRKAIPYSMPLHLFGAGHPLTMAISVALGCDTFDSASYILFARQGRYMTEQGILRIQEMRYLPCSCPSCNGTTVAEILELDGPQRVKKIAIHNLHLLKREVDNCKEAIAEGRLWDLVEARAAAHPRLFDAFLAFANEKILLTPGTPRTKDRGLMVRGVLDLMRPELASASKRLAGAKWRTQKSAVLLVSEEQLPINKMGLRRGGLPRKGYDIYRLHPMLGLYPAELDFIYPFTQTVSTKTTTSGEEVKDATNELRRMGYSDVLTVKVGRGGKISSQPAKSRPKPKGASPSPPSASARFR